MGQSGSSAQHPPPRLPPAPNPNAPLAFLSPRSLINTAQTYSRSLASEVLTHPPTAPHDPPMTPMGVAEIALVGHPTQGNSLGSGSASAGFVHSGLEYLEQHAVQH